MYFMKHFIQRDETNEGCYDTKIEPYRDPEIQYGRIFCYLEATL